MISVINYIRKFFISTNALGNKSMSPAAASSKVDSLKVHVLIINEYTKKILEQIKTKLTEDYGILRDQEKKMIPLTDKHKEITKQLQIIADNITKINTELNNKSDLYSDAMLMIKHKMMTFSNIRKYFVLTSQICGILLCVYFLLHVQSYEISWRWSWILPTVIVNSAAYNEVS